MLSLARRSGGIFELVLNIPNVIAVSLSIADPSRADHTNRVATNVCLEAACQCSFAAPKLAAPVRCLLTVAVITPPVLLCNINARRHAITLSRLLCLAALFAGVQINGAYVLTIDVKLSGGWVTARILTSPRTFPCGQFLPDTATFCLLVSKQWQQKFLLQHIDRATRWVDPNLAAAKRSYTINDTNLPQMEA